MRILCLDIGTKRIGVAVSDPFGWTAQPVTTLLRDAQKRELVEILRLCHEYEVQKIVVGLPLDAEGKMGTAASLAVTAMRKIERFLREHHCGIPVEPWDERYTTRDAEQRLLQADVSRHRRRQVIDKMAAVVLLEHYLESLKGDQ